MQEIVQDFGTAAIVEAIEKNIYGFADFGRTPGGEVHNEPEALWYFTCLPVIGSMTLRAQFSPGNAHSHIEHILQQADARHVSLNWIVGPSTHPSNMGEYLEAHNLKRVNAWTGMAIDMNAMPDDRPLPEGLTIVRADTSAGVEQWAHVQTQGAMSAASVLAQGLCELGIPLGLSPSLPWRFYVGLLHGVPVATSALLLSAGVAGVHWVATLPVARGQGIGSAMVMAPLSDARALGYQLGVLKASEMGRGVYRRLGFQEYHVFPIYRWSGRTETTSP